MTGAPPSPTATPDHKLPAEFRVSPFWRLMPAGMRRRWWLFRPLDLLARLWPVGDRRGLLCVRMDGIGDMVLFRGALDHYAEVFGLERSEITVLGCESWQGIAPQIFEGYEVLFINEHAYAKRPLYRFRVNLRVRRLAPAIVVTDQYFRRALMADSLTWVTGAPRQIVSLPYVNQPTRLDEEYANNEMFHKVIAHGMWGGALISAVLGTNLPGPGTIYIGQTLKFRRPVGIGDTVTVSVTASSKDDEKKSVVFDCLCANQDGKPVIDGTATVLAPTEKVRRPRPVLPEVLLHDRGAKLRTIVDKAGNLPPVKAAVAHPVHDYSLSAVAEAARAGLIDPVLVGPEERIRSAAEEGAIDISGLPIVAAEHSHRSAITAVAMARATEVNAVIMSSHYGAEMMHAAVQRGTGIRSNRRMSHVAVVDMPFYDRPLLVTDAYINTDPGLDDKRDIVVNAVELARALGVETPNVALVAATHAIENTLRSTVEAAALCKMADRGQIENARLEGPLPYDMAVSNSIARRKGVVSDVCGAADIVVCPHLEAGHLLVKQLASQARAQTAHVILGGRVPILLPSKVDETLPRLASFALAAMMAAPPTGDSG